jgi:hypothetical protein
MKNDIMDISVQLRDSNCNLTVEELNFIQEDLFEDQEVLLTRLFDASQDGWDANSIHLKIDNKGPILVLMRVENGSAIGGKTNVS